MRIVREMDSYRLYLWPQRRVSRLFGVAIAVCLSTTLLLSLTACTSASAQSQISVETLTVQMEQAQPPVILDVRSPAEYAAGHIPGAINVEYREVPAQIERIRAYEGRDVVVYCERGVRATRAENALIEAGFANVTQLSGHMPAWREAGLPVETGF